MIPEILIGAIVLVYGLCIGSFLNVCICRIPKRKSIVFPASHCPKCKAKIPWYYNIPVLSYAVLKGRCASCGKEISMCYPVVEFLTGAFALLVYRSFAFRESGVFLAVIYFFYICALIVITGIDLRYFIIPDVISLPGIAFGVFFSFLVPSMQGKELHVQGLLSALISAAAGSGILFSIAVLGTLIFKKEAMGMGDVKLAGMFGAFMGLKLTLLSIFLASIVGSIAGVSLIVLRRAKMQSRIPFGPYLAAGAVIALFWGEGLWNAYVRLITGGI